MKKIIFSFMVLVVATSTWAWEPTKPINVMVGSGPGSAIEMNFRVVAHEVEKQNPGTNFVITLKPGGDSAVMLNDLVKQKPDGHSIGAVAHMSLFVTHEIWQKNVMQYDYKSFKTPFMIAKSPLVIVARPSSDVSTPTEFINKLKNPAYPVTVAIGGGAHKITYEYIMTKINGNTSVVQTARYSGPLQAVTAVASGEVEFGIMPLSVASPLIKANKVKIIALTTDTKLASMPTVPLMKDYVPGLNAFAGVFIALPLDTPDDVVEWYRTKFTQAIRSESVKQKYYDNYLYYSESELTQKGMTKFVNDLRAQWLPIAKNIQE